MALRLFGCLAACAAATAAAAAAAADGDVEVVQVDTIVLGGGPAGVQQAAFLKARGRDFLLLERDSVPGSFFLRYPRHGKLISVNKPYTGTSNPEYNMRFDWHTLLSPLSEEAAANRTWRPPNRYHGALKTRQDVLAGINAPHLDADAASASRGGGGGGWNQALPHDMPRFDARYSEDYFPSSPRVVDYLEDFVEHHGLRGNIRYGTRAFRVLAGPDFDGAARGEARGGGGGRKFVVKTTVSAAPGAACFDALHDGSSGGSGACPVREVHFVCRHLFVATGLSKPAAIRYHLPGQRKSERPRGPRMDGWEHVAIIDDFDLTLASYRNASVLVLGKGNSGFETANSLVPVADSVTVIARSPHRFSWQTHYPPNLRAVNNNFLQHARFLPGHHLLAEVDLTESAIVKAPGGKLRLLSRAEAEAVAAGTLALSAATDLLGRSYDHVISAVGFQFDFSVYAPPVRPVPFPNGRYPLSTASYESANVPGMWFIGTLQHSRDFRRSSGGVLDGFRYLARATFYQMELAAHGRRWPATTVLPAVERAGGFAPLQENGEPAPVAFDPWVQAVTELLMKRANEASGLFLMFTVLTDVILLRQDGATGAIVGATHFEDVPRDFIPALLADEERRAVEQAAAQGEEHGGAGDAAFTLHVVTLNIEFGQCNGMKAGDIETDPFNAQGYGYFAVSPRMRYWRHEHRAGAGAPPAVDGAETAAGAAGAGFFDVTRPWAQHLVVEEQLATWYDEVEHVAPVRRFVRQVLLEGLEQPLAWPALVHLYQWPSQQDAPSCVSFVLWQSLRNAGSGMGMREFGWLAGRLEGAVAEAEKKALDSDAASVADAAAGAAEVAAAVVGPEPGSAGDNDPATNGVTQNGGDWPLHRPHKNAFADACDGSDGPQQGKGRQKCAMSDRGFVPSVVRRSKDKLPHCDDAPWPEVPLRDGAEHEYDYIIVGAGPAGVQLAAHLQALGGGDASVLLLERDGSPASFFRKYPRHRYLASVNKRATGSADGEYNLRADWHTLLHPAGSVKAPLLFGEHSAEFHPFADDFVSYVCRYARHHEVPLALHAEVESITKDTATGSFSVAVGGGAGGGSEGGGGTKLLRAKQVVVATGLSLERGPHLAHPLTETYGTYDIDPAKYVNKTVMVLGNGASALEIAETLAAVTRTTHLLGKPGGGDVPSSNFGFSFSSGYQEHPGATQSNFLDTYSLKTNNVYGLHDASELRDLFVRSEKTGQIHYMSRDGENGCGGAFAKLGESPSEAALQAALEEHYFKPASANVLHPCFYGYDHVITAFGWSLDASILPPRAQHGVKRHKRTPRMSDNFEASGVPGLFYAGELMHDAPAPKERGGSFSKEQQQQEKDEDGNPLEPAKRGPGRQWYGIRYRVQALARHLAAKNQGVGWLAAAAGGGAARAAAAAASAAELLQRQIQSGSGSFLDAELVDVVLARAEGGAEGGALLLDALPAGSLASMAATAFGGAEAAAAAMGDVDAYFTLRWEAGVCFSFANNDRLVVSDPFRVAPGREGRQPVVRRFVRQAAAAAAVAAPAAGLGGYAEAGTLRLPYDRLARFADPAGKYRAALEAFVASRAVAPEPSTALALASGAPSCTADVLWDRLQSPHSGLTLADLRWLRERAQELAAAKAVPLPLHDALMDFGVHEDMVQRNVSKHELFRYLVYTRNEEDDSPISQLSSGSRFMKEYAQQACDGKIAVSSKEQDYLAKVLRKGCKFAASPDMHPMFSGGRQRIGSAEGEEDEEDEEGELREDEEDE